MSDPKQAVIDELTAHLDELSREAADTKRTINSLLRRMGQQDRFPDVEPEGYGNAALKPDQFFGKPLSTAVREVLELRGQALPPADILTALEKGGFNFDDTGWKKNDRLRSLSITLSKNSQTFVKLPSGTFGLRSAYPGLAAPPVKKAKNDNGGGEAEGDDAETTEQE
jgi:hypothetical protein